MAEATLTEVNAFTLLPGIGGGAKLIAMRAQIDDGETITTDLHNVLAVFFSTFDNVAADWHICAAASHSGTGTITTSVGAIGDYADDASLNFYAIIIGY